MHDPGVRLPRHPRRRRRHRRARHQPRPAGRQLKFDEKYSLGFPLLSDADHAVAAQFGAWGPKKLYGREYEGVIRSAFLIDEKGMVSHAWPKISPKDTPKNLLKALAG